MNLKDYEDFNRSTTCASSVGGLGMWSSAMSCALSLVTS